MKTYAELKTFLDGLTEEQLSQRIEIFPGCPDYGENWPTLTLCTFEVLDEDYINMGEGLELRSSYEEEFEEPVCEENIPEAKRRHAQLMDDIGDAVVIQEGTVMLHAIKAP